MPTYFRLKSGGPWHIATPDGYSRCAIFNSGMAGLHVDRTDMEAVGPNGLTVGGHVCLHCISTPEKPTEFYERQRAEQLSKPPASVFKRPRE
jgi:hypothetical protein